MFYRMKQKCFFQSRQRLPVRVKGGMSLRNGIIIIQNTIYAGNKLTEEASCFRANFTSSSFFDAADSNRILTTIRGLDRLIVDLEEVRVKKS